MIVLVYGGSLHLPFQPGAIAYSQRTGRLYHPWVGKGSSSSRSKGYGLIRSQIALELCEHISGLGDGDDGSSSTLAWGGKRYEIKPLPLEYEPLYGLPP